MVLEEVGLSFEIEKFSCDTYLLPKHGVDFHLLKSKQVQH